MKTTTWVLRVAAVASSCSRLQRWAGRQRRRALRRGRQRDRGRVHHRHDGAPSGRHRDGSSGPEARRASRDPRLGRRHHRRTGGRDLGDGGDSHRYARHGRARRRPHGHERGGDGHGHGPGRAGKRQAVRPRVHRRDGPPSRRRRGDGQAAAQERRAPALRRMAQPSTSSTPSPGRSHRCASGARRGTARSARAATRQYTGRADPMGEPLTARRPETTVLHVGGLHYASEKSVVEHVLAGRPGVIAVEANPVAQTATDTYNPAASSVAELRAWVEQCGFHRAGQSVPGHVCDPMAEAAAAHQAMGPRGDGPRGGSPRPWPRRPCRHVDGGDGARRAQPLPRRARVHDPDRPVVGGRQRAARHRARHPVRARSRDLAAVPQPAGRGLRVVDPPPARSRRCGPGRWT